MLKAQSVLACWILLRDVIKSSNHLHPIILAWVVVLWHNIRASEYGQMIKNLAFAAYNLRSWKLSL